MKKEEFKGSSLIKEEVIFWGPFSAHPFNKHHLLWGHNCEPWQPHLYVGTDSALLPSAYQVGTGWSLHGAVTRDI